MGSPERENSIRQLVSRVADTITSWGRDGESAAYANMRRFARAFDFGD